jgi:hypothetical protein
VGPVNSLKMNALLMTAMFDSKRSVLDSPLSERTLRFFLCSLEGGGRYFAP